MPGNFNAVCKIAKEAAALNANDAQRLWVLRERLREEKITKTQMDLMATVAVKFQERPCLVTPAGFLADNKKYKAADLLRQAGANVYAIAYVYLMKGDSGRVEIYRTQYGVDISGIVQHYAKLCVDEAAVDALLARTLPEERKQTIFGIMQGYMRVNNHSKVDQYCSLYRNELGIREIARCFKETYLSKEAFDIPLLYRAIAKIPQQPVGDAMIRAIERLYEGQKNRWNPYWMNCGEKLHELITVIDALPDHADWNALVKDSNSTLYHALNKQRIGPVTVLGRFGFYHAKSLFTAEDALKTPRVTA